MRNGDVFGGCGTAQAPWARPCFVAPVLLLAAAWLSFWYADRSLPSPDEGAGLVAARLAAERRDKADLKEMRDALAAMRRHTLATEAGRTADREFHNAVLAATRNDALVVLTASIGAAVAWTTQFKQRSRALPRNPVPDHVKVYDAIAAGDV